MKASDTIVRGVFLIVSLGGIANWGDTAIAQTSNLFRIIELKNTVEIQPPDSKAWVFTGTNQVLGPHWRLRTGANSRATLKSLSDESVEPIRELSEIEIAAGEKPGQHLLGGICYFFHRGKPSRFELITHSAFAGIKGTEFVVKVEGTNDTGRTTLSVIDGSVDFTNEFGALNLNNGQQAAAEPGLAPYRTPGFNATPYICKAFAPTESPANVRATVSAVSDGMSGDNTAAIARQLSVNFRPATG